MQYLNPSLCPSKIYFPPKWFQLNVILTQENNLRQPFACKTSFLLREDIFFGLHRKFEGKISSLFHRDLYFAPQKLRLHPQKLEMTKTA